MFETAFRDSRRFSLAGALMCALMAIAACNPFAPEIDTASPTGQNIISDQRSVEGVFQNFRYAYTFKDTTIYGGLLAHDFVFTYRDYDKMIDQNWGRDEEMRTTARLFGNADDLSLIWNEIVGFSGDSLRANVTRSFNLTITFNPSDIIRVDGRATLDLRRAAPDDAWQIARWKDESNY